MAARNADGSASGAMRPQSARDAAPRPVDAEAPADGAPAVRRRGSRAGGKRRRATATEHSSLGEKFIAGVPARIMRPRLVFAACLCALLAFGLLMVYSASSVEALKEEGSALYYVTRQALFMGLGGLFFAFIAARPVSWEFFFRTAAWVWWAVVLALLLVVAVAGSGGDEWGASRWILIGPFSLQPSELAKPAIVLTAAKIFADYYEDRSIDSYTFAFQLALCVLLPLAFIFKQPDLGTTLIITGTVLIMAFFSGISLKLAVGVVVGIAALGGISLMLNPYQLQRFAIAFDPWADPYGDGYQATLAIMAFASGGLFGRGIGNSTMKYHYLPEAHNDYIMAIVGEELGFAGTLLFIIVFLSLIAAAFVIALRSPTLHGQLVASGCALALALQFLINLLGILSVIPMTGKPMPFISYGGSSVLASMILAALIFRVSLESDVVTAADMRRSRMAVLDEADAASGHMGRSTAGEARGAHVRRAWRVPRVRRRPRRHVGRRKPGRHGCRAPGAAWARVRIGRRRARGLVRTRGPGGSRRADAFGLPAGAIRLFRCIRRGPSAPVGRWPHVAAVSWRGPLWAIRFASR